MRIDIRLALCTVIALCAAAPTDVKGEIGEGADKVVVYPAPKGAALSTQYDVKVNGKPVDVYIAPVREEYFGGPYSFAYFDFADSVEVAVRSTKPLDKVHVLPESRGIQHRLKGDTINFALKSPCQLSIEPDGKNGPLLLFANPLEKDRPRPGDTGVVYFGPGMHKPGEIKLSDNQTLYIAGGAVVKGGISAQGTNIRIAGRGIIDGLEWPRYKGPTGNVIGMRLCNSANVEGVILKDSWSWTFVLQGCRDVQIDNVKICSTRCANNDGIGVVNSQQVTIENCFVRSEDDSITAKGYGWPDRDRQRDGMAVEDVTVSNCTLWADNAHVWRIGYECWAEGIRRLTYRNIDVLHWCDMIALQPGEDMAIEDVRFENIRINGEGHDAIFEISPQQVYVMRKNGPGHIRNVMFKDVIFTGAKPADTGLIQVSGCDANHIVENVVFDNVVRYGKRVTEKSTNVEVEAHTKNIVFK